MKSSRRKFIKLAGLTALGWSVCPSLASARSNRYRKIPGALKADRWAMAIDIQKLSDEVMQKAIEACHRLHNVPDIDSRQNVKWIWVETFKTLFDDQVHAHQMEGKEKLPLLTLCNHCDNPPCVRVCPTKATFKRHDGIVLMDFHRCIGCRFCMAGCPYGSRSFNYSDPRRFLNNDELSPDYPTRSKGVVEKCEFCAHLVDQGERPACVEAAEGVLFFGDLSDPDSEVRRVLRDRYSLVRKAKLGTEPQVYYLI